MVFTVQGQFKLGGRGFDVLQDDYNNWDRVSTVQNGPFICIYSGGVGLWPLWFYRGRHF